MGSLDDKVRQKEIDIVGLKKEIKERDIQIENLTVQKERLLITNHISKELNLAKFQNKTGSLGKEIL